MGAVWGDLGPANVEWGGTDLGANQKVTAKYVQTTADHKTAQYGAEAKDKIYTGHRGEVEILLTETTLAQLAAVLDNAVLTGSEVMVGSPVGTSLRSIAQKLVIKPIIGGVASTDAKEWITFFVSAPIIDMEQVFDAETDRGYKATFHCFGATEVPTGETYEVGDLYAVGYGQTS